MLVRQYIIAGNWTIAKYKVRDRAPGEGSRFLWQATKDGNCLHGTSEEMVLECIEILEAQQ